MENNILRGKDTVSKSKEELFNYINSSEDFQDLTMHFGELYKRSPEVYEIIILMYQEFQTREKINKRKLSSILNYNIEIKENTLNILNQIVKDIEKVSKKVEGDRTFLEKVKDNMSFSNAWKLLGIVLTMMFALGLFAHFEPDTFDKIYNTMLTLK